MPYTNTIVETSTSGTWDGTSFSYGNISLIAGIPHSAQLEVERVFTVPRDTTNYATIEDFLNNSATTQKDKQQVFIIPASRITFNETGETITAIDLPSTGNTYDFTPDGIGLANVPVPAIAISDTIKVRRKTVSNQSLVEWSAGTKLTSAQLNLEVKQLLYLVQELIDKTTTEVTVSNTAIGTIPNYSILPVKLSTGGPTWTSGGALTSLSIQNTPIGSTTRSSGAFTTLAANGATSLTGTLAVSAAATMTAGTASSSTTTGALIVTGGVGVSGTVYAGGFNGPLTGTIQTAAQPNITSLGTLSSLTVSGNIKNANPSFCVRNQTLTTTGTCKFSVEDLDSSAAYNPSTGLFTAPTAGTYLFTANIFGYVDASAKYFNWVFYKNGAQYGCVFHSSNMPAITSTSDGAHTHTVDPASVTSGAASAGTAHTHPVDVASTTSSSGGAHTHNVQNNISYQTVTGTIIVDLAQNDTIGVYFNTGTPYVGNFSSFSGYLIG